MAETLQLAGDELLEARRAQVAELEAMDCIYCDDFKALTSSTQSAIAEDIEHGGAAILGGMFSAFELGCSFTLSAGHGQGVASVELHVTMPITYPALAPPQVSLVNCTLPRALTSALQQNLRDFVLDEHIPGCELLLQLVSHAQEALGQAQKEASEAVAAAAAATAGSASVAAIPRIGRAVVWFHHIKSPKKKASIAAWSNELNTRGFAKPGYPGVLYAEGEKDNVDELLRRMRAQRWKAMAVRAEEWGDVPPGSTVSAAALYTVQCGWDGSAGIEFLGEVDMGEAAARFERMGLGPLFMRAVLKMKPVGADEGGACGGSDSD